MSSAGPILSANPIALYSGMWSSGIWLNTNVYWECDAACHYCYVRNARASQRKQFGSTRGDYDGATRFSQIITRAFSDKYNDHDPVQFALRHRMPVMLSNNSDPFPSIEACYGYTYQYLSAYADVGMPVLILTKFPGWDVLDKDRYLTLLSDIDRLWIEVTLTSLDEEMLAEWEPNAPSAKDRLEIIRTLTNAGIDVSINVVPFIPEVAFKGRADDPATYRRFCEEARAVGARAVFQSPLACNGSGAQRDPVLKAYVAAHQAIKSKTDAPWRWWIPDPAYDQAVAAAWHEAAAEVGLECTTHAAHGSLLDKRPDPSRLGSPPDWLDRPASWGRAIEAMRRQQQKSGKPVIANVHDLVNYVMHGVPWSDQQFRKTSVVGFLGIDTMTAEGRAKMTLLPELITPREMMYVQHQSLTEWSDAVWTDRAVSPIADENGDNITNEFEDLLLYFDVNKPRESWAVCRATHGWAGIPVDEAEQAEAIQWADWREVN